MLLEGAILILTKLGVVVVVELFELPFPPQAVSNMTIKTGNRRIDFMFFEYCDSDFDFNEITL